MNQLEPQAAKMVSVLTGANKLPFFMILGTTCHEISNFVAIFCMISPDFVFEAEPFLAFNSAAGGSVRTLLRRGA